MRNFSVTAAPLAAIASDALVVGVFEAENADAKTKTLDAALDGLIAQVIANKEFAGKAGEVLALYPGSAAAAKKILLAGLGKRSGYTLAALRKTVGAASTGVSAATQRVAFSLPKRLPKKAAPADVGSAVVESLLEGCYRFIHYKKASAAEHLPKNVTEIVFAAEAAHKAALTRGARTGEVLADAVNYTRDLANHPGNVMTPQKLAGEAMALGKAEHITVRILEKADMRKLGMGALLSINQGSVLPPKFIILEYNMKKSGAPTVLVGKGITFDSGGISIKPAKSMEEMKFDMAGGAAVLGVFKAAAQLKLPVKLVGLIPATENLPSGSAVKPGDVVTAMGGKTIEMINTDAEGRMVLADALAYAERYKPKAVIDFATLTGAMVVALGNDITGAFTNDDRLLDRVVAAGEKAGEEIWPMPLPDSYKPHIKSHVADIKNIGADPWGGAIAGAAFLEEFVSYPWVHLDIAGTAWTTAEAPGRAKGATGVGVKTTIEFLKN